MTSNNLEKLSKLIRYYILSSTTTAGSGHPTSSLSAVDLMTALWFGRPSYEASEAESGYFWFDFDHPENPYNDRLVFSKGHASPLYYSLFLAAGVITPEDIMKLRKFDSPLEGHPTPKFKYTEAATGSLGQGLSVGVGLALAVRQLSEFRIQNSVKNNQNPGFRNPKSKFQIPNVYVLLGDGEMAEGSVWEGANLASYYKLNNLVAIVDVNRLGQTQETMWGWNTKVYEERFKAFGWETIVIDGHDYSEIEKAYSRVQSSEFRVQKPFAIIAKTVKGKGVSFIEDKDGWHGKPLKTDELEKALKELGDVDLKIRGVVEKPELRIRNQELRIQKIPNSYFQIFTSYNKGDQIATRKAYGTALAKYGDAVPNLIVLDAETKNSTYSEDFKKAFPDRFYECFIAEQNMVGVAIGFSRLGYVPFLSSFACFLTRAYDQFRMAALSEANIKICGSHAGVSIGEDGPSQMGLEDIAMFRAVSGSVVLYPSDAVSTEKLVGEMIKHKGLCYLRTTRPATPVIYENNEEFPIGGCKIHTIKNPNSKFQNPNKIQIPKSKIIIITAGITLFEALKAQGELLKEGIEATVVDLYSIKPIDEKTLKSLVALTTHNPQPTTQIITVEDHWFEGGLGDAVLNVFADQRVKVHKLAVSKMPRSGKPSELLAFEGIDSVSIIAKVKSIV